jgi:hypothetical protein
MVGRIEDSTKVFYKWSNCVTGFDLPLVLKDKDARIEAAMLEMYYIGIK